MKHKKWGNKQLAKKLSVICDLRLKIEELQIEKVSELSIKY